MYSMASSIDTKMGFSKEYLLHDNIFFILGEPFSLGFDLTNRKVGRCKARSEIKGSFSDACQLEFESLPTEMINIIGYAFNQWLGAGHYENPGVLSRLNVEGNRQLEPYNLRMDISNNSLVITNDGKQITYEAMLRYLLNYNMVSEYIPTTHCNREEDINTERKGILSKIHDIFMESFYEGLDKTSSKMGNSSASNTFKEKGFLAFMKESFLKGFYGDDYDNKSLR